MLKKFKIQTRDWPIPRQEQRGASMTRLQQLRWQGWRLKVDVEGKVQSKWQLRSAESRPSWRLYSSSRGMCRCISKAWACRKVSILTSLVLVAKPSKLERSAGSSTWSASSGVTGQRTSLRQAIRIHRLCGSPKSRWICGLRKSRVQEMKHAASSRWNSILRRSSEQANESTQEGWIMKIEIQSNHAKLKRATCTRIRKSTRIIATRSGTPTRSQQGPSPRRSWRDMKERATMWAPTGARPRMFEGSRKCRSRMYKRQITTCKLEQRRRKGSSTTNIQRLWSCRLQEHRNISMGSAWAAWNRKIGNWGIFDCSNKLKVLTRETSRWTERARIWAHS